MRILTSSLIVGATLAAVLPAQAAPDVVVGAGTLELNYALVDRDANGDYSARGEAWDFWIDTVDSSTRAITLSNGYFVWIDGNRDQLLSGADANANGIIEQSETLIYYDAITRGMTTPNWLAEDPNGWIWWTNDGGSFEGIWRSKDLNNDGDAEDTGETVQAIDESFSVPIGNAPNSGGATLSTTGLDSIEYDPTWGNGRFLCEDENTDQVIAFEDLNGDGDFLDAGEVYLFCALWNSGTLAGELHPDAGIGNIPICNELGDFAVDPNSGTYYLLSRDSTTANPDAAILLAAVDNNNDGDVNDTGELREYWDGSLDSLGATNTYQWATTVEFFNGGVYVIADYRADPNFTTRDHDQLLRLDDNNNDGDADDPGETVVLWDYPFDNTLYDPLLLPAGAIVTPTGIAGSGTQYGLPCLTSTGGNHELDHGSSLFDDKVVLNNANFSLQTTGATVNSAGVFLVGVTKLPFGVPLGSCNLYHSNDFPPVVPFNTDGLGSSLHPLPIPNDPTLLGVATYWQNAVLDLGAPLNFTLSNGMEIYIGTYSFTTRDP